MTTAEAAAGTIGPSATPWWVVLLEGITLVIVGVLLVTDTEQTVATLVLFLGIWWFIGGIFDVISIFLDRAHWGWKLFSGILGIVAGLVIIRHPIWAAVLVPASLVWILGIFGIIIGGIGLIRAVQGAGWGTGILGVVSVFSGLILLSANVGVAIATAMLVVAIGSIAGGIVAIIYAFRVRSMSR